MGLSHITTTNGFHSMITSSSLVVIDFYATWCGPCKVLAPKLEALANKYHSVRFCKVDVDATQMQEIASSQNVSAMPTIVFYKRGREIDRVVGADIKKIETLVSKHM